MYEHLARFVTIIVGEGMAKGLQIACLERNVLVSIVALG